MANYVEQLSFTPYVNPYVKGPVEEYKELQTELRNRYDTVSSKYDALRSEAQKMAALQPDETKKKAIIDEVNNQFKQAVEAGDFENRDRIVNQAILKFQKDYAPVAQQVKAYQDRKAYYDERVKQGMKPEHAQQALKYEMDMYSKQREDGSAGFEVDPETGEARRGFSNYAKDRANDFNVTKHILEVIKPKLNHPMKEGTQIIKENGRYVYTTESGRKEVLKPELQKLIFDSFKSNDEWQAYEKDKAFYDTYNLDDNQLNQEKLNIINKEAELLQDREITDSLLNKTVEQLRKQGVKNPREKALTQLRSQGYLDSKFVKDRINGLVNADAKSLLMNNLINENVSKAASFASDYAYKETEYKEDFKAWTKEHELAAEKKFTDAQNTWNTQAETTYEDYNKLLGERQETAKKLANTSSQNWLTYNNNFIKDNNLPSNFNTLSFSKELNKLKQTLPPAEFEQKAKALLQAKGIKGDLRTIIEDASDIFDSYQQYKKGKQELENISKINSKVYNIIENKEIINNSIDLYNSFKQGKLDKSFLEKNNINSPEQLVLFTLNNENIIKNMLGKFSYDVQSKQQLNNLYQSLNKQKEVKKDKLAEVVNTGFILSNPDDKSTIGSLNKTIEEGIGADLGKQVVVGTDNFDLNSYLNGIADKEDFTIESYKLENARIYSTSNLGNKKIRANIIVKGTDGKERKIPVDIKPGANENLINKTILSSYKAGTLPKESNILVEQGYYNEAVENPEDLDMLENTETNSVVLQSKLFDYKVDKMPNGRFRLTEKSNPNFNESLRTLDEVKQLIGKLETKQAVKNNNL